MSRQVKMLLLFFLLAGSVFSIARFAGSGLLAQPQPAGKTVSPADLPVREYNHRTGSGGAVTVLVFSDFQCSSCRTAAQALDRLAEEFAREITLVYKHYPLPRFANSFAAALAAEAAGAQGKFWDMHDLLYERQSEWTDAAEPVAVFGQWAAQLGLDVEQFRRDVASEEVAERVRQDIADGQQLEIIGTPTIYVNGTPLPVKPTYRNLKRAIELALEP
ncbi:MAG: thioredoxin domain-containing protein [Firmicutes bacterium]|jgi:protein-disulfide isomerase|nr:thioredoxin domain-containing protein [Bacillota bacterium]HOB35408.1 thioredoxin domain-containing protein [Bacillota bacterium]HPZ91223.1 thioredoxin domain-containing protein [Bacillota bacterium]HQE02359.1 thioredoxin domain-containing protein [Bacillota bacterium]